MNLRMAFVSLHHHVSSRGDRALLGKENMIITSWDEDTISVFPYLLVAKQH